jgi:recombination protein RecT
MNTILEPKKNERDIMALAESKIVEMQNTGAIDMPKNYSVGNALKSAMLAIKEAKDHNKKPALQCCTSESIANSLLNMVIQGLSPAKKQCYFVVYGDQLQCLRSYHGTKAVVKRLKNVTDVVSNVIYEGDVFETDIVVGVKKVIEHKQQFKNIDNDKIVGAYCTIIFSDGNTFSDWMSLDQIKRSWQKSRGYGTGKQSVHTDFPDQMAMRTVINRTCKSFVSTSDDSDILLDAFNRTDIPFDECESKPIHNFKMPVKIAEKYIDPIIPEDEIPKNE